MTSTEDFKRTKPDPPSYLSKEHVGLWTAWCVKGDREVAREAGAKGIHVDLVVNFLSLRRNIRTEEAENYFRDEVFKWVKELLDRKQIFKVSHVLKNIGVDPQEELSKVFFTTTNTEMREYIGNHLKSQNKLDDNLLQLWQFLDLMLKNNLLVSKYRLSEDSIECLHKQNPQWKAEISAKLFLRTQDTLLINFLNGEALWKQLLAYNDINLLKTWINLQYSDQHYTDISENLLKAFKSYSISNDMINQLNTSVISTNTSNVILNELSKFGMFSDKDLGSFLNILQRISQTDNLRNIFKLIRKTTSNISEERFLDLLVEYCISNDFHTVLSACVENFDVFELNSIHNTNLELILNFRKLTHDFSIDNLLENILNVSKFFSDDLEQFFQKNPLILLALIQFTKDVEFVDILEKSSFRVSDLELTKSIANLPKNLSMIDCVLNRETIIENSTLTFYHLLEKHYKVNVKKMFAFRFENSPLPNFNTSELVEKYGYLKKVNYLFYVKQFRPSIAAKMYLLYQYKKHGCIPELSIKHVKMKIFRIALKNFTSLELTSSCVAFLEMIGLDANFLKTAIDGATKIHEYEADFENVREIFLNIENDPNTILNKLEYIVLEKIDFERFTEGVYFVESLKLYDTVVNFTISYNLRLPELFLRSCAAKNMWLPFLTFSQLKNYPVDQLKPLVQSFKNPSLLEHVYHSVCHDILIDDQNVFMRDSRTTYLSRIGVRKSADNLVSSGSIYSSYASASSYGSNASSSGSDFLEIDINNTKTTLLQTLIRCHNSTDPPRALLQACQLYRNPLLAIFATSYEPDSVITNWLTSLAVSSELYETFTNFESIAICGQSVATFLENCMKHRFPKTLLRSFKIFLPSNPLRHFLAFLNYCIDKNFDKKLLTTKLAAFKTSLQKCRRYSVLSDTDHEMTYLNNKVWIETTALRLLSSTIEFNVPSLYEQIKLLQELCTLNMQEFIGCPDLEKLLDILRIVHDSKSEVRFSINSIFDENSARQAVVDCMNGLLEESMFEHALKIAKIEGLPLDLILVKRWHKNFESRTEGDTDFWTESNKHFQEHNITADCVIEFYLSYIDRVQSNLEEYLLLKLAYDWSRKFELSTKYDLERRKWLAYATLEEKSRVDDVITEEHPQNVSFKEMCDMIKTIGDSDADLPVECVVSLKNTLCEALDRGNVWLALKLEKMFGVTDSNLDILKLCYSLAEGLVLPYQLSAEQRLIVNKGTHFRGFSHRRMMSNRFPSMSSTASHSSACISYLQPSDNSEAPVQDTLAILCNLAEKVTVGSTIAKAIFMTYRISINIEIPYHLIVSNWDSMKMLKDALGDDCLNKLEVVHDFFGVYKWSKEQMADFICEEIITSATKYIKSKSDTFTMWDLSIDQDFHSILQLLQDNCSLLGYKIYSYASAMHKSQVLADLDFRISEIALVIELLITAHECFTADCNMEGISIVLKKCQAVISHLLNLRSWKLIVRLLTGVGRYTEMNYAFQILRENDQFEFLLRKGSRRDNGLKTALLEYLKKYCPDNRELYKIVALHFTLFSEVALLWEREAQGAIRNLIEISRLEMQNNKMNPDSEPYVLFTNTDGTKICLNKAIENYTYATEFHLQGEKLAKAMNSAKQAELIALQKSLLKGSPNNGTALCLLNLNQGQISRLISNELSFDQSLILIQAYNYQPDWSQVLFEQCITKNNAAYLTSFLKHRSMTESLANDISRKFLIANINTTNEINSMKGILEKVPSVHAKYRLASELGFTDIVEGLLQGGQLAYLKDTVWKKGYKS
ncbi:unnamed protein product [Phaedon cochleariae]|uniref:Spatacsin C-terminal domain-containing protein n=1 Tax=Phaedon cochleariae TaxID=80249 RepID=A0A9P0DMY2_PHACE|nr:unnamed protein product [Phaedon cochleariae]